MSWCYDKFKHEREGRDAALCGDRYDSEHMDRMRGAMWDHYSCDAAYADGYESELRRQREEREEEERAEERERVQEGRRRVEQMEHEHYIIERYDEDPIP